MRLDAQTLRFFENYGMSIRI